MPAFVLLPASPSDLEAVARVQFAACATDPGFRVIFPKGGTLTSITHFVQSYEHDMDNDPSFHIMIVKEAMSGEIASFAIWHFFPPRSGDEIDRELLLDDFPLPQDANKEVGCRLMRNSIRKRHELVTAFVGLEQPYAYLAALGTSPKYQRQGAGAKLLEWGLERADDRGLAVYVEGTPAASHLYKVNGFREIETLKMELAPWSTEEHSNLCMIRDPQT